MLAYPALRSSGSIDNHGLLRVSNRPQWRTVTGGSRAYVERLTACCRDRIGRGIAAKRVRGDGGRAGIRGFRRTDEWFDHVVIAAHADEALAMLEAPSHAERSLLGAFRYSRNRASSTATRR